MTETSAPSGGPNDTPYPPTYHQELSPAWLVYAAAVNGMPAAALDVPFRYLELGCGRALSTLIHAEAFPLARFHACDLDRACIDSARALAAELGIGNVTLHCASFAELEGLDLPPFDFVVAHGVYSWVDPDARAAIRSLLSTRLTAGGIAYLSYNCMPGWNAELPLRRLMTELAVTQAGNAAARAGAAARVLGRLSDTGSGYFGDNPDARAAVRAYLRAPDDYLAHELLGHTFTAFYSVDVADEMAEAGLALLGSATLADNHLPLMLSDAAAQAISALPTVRQRRLADDVAVNRRFRRDLFIRAAAACRRRDGPDLSALVGCRRDPATIATRVRVPRGIISFDHSFVRGVRTALADGAMSLDALTRQLSRRTSDRPQVLRNLLYLVAGGELCPCARPGQLPGGSLEHVRRPGKFG